MTANKILSFILSSTILITSCLSPSNVPKSEINKDSKTVPIKVNPTSLPQTPENNIEQNNLNQEIPIIIDSNNTKEYQFNNISLKLSENISDNQFEIKLTPRQISSIPEIKDFPEDKAKIIDYFSLDINNSNASSNIQEFDIKNKDFPENEKFLLAKLQNEELEVTHTGSMGKDKIIRFFNIDKVHSSYNTKTFVPITTITTENYVVVNIPDNKKKMPVVIDAQTSSFIMDSFKQTNNNMSFNLFIAGYADALIEVYDKTGEIIKFTRVEGNAPPSSFFSIFLSGDGIYGTMIKGWTDEYPYYDKRDGGSALFRKETVNEYVPDGGKLVISKNSYYAKLINIALIGLDVASQILSNYDIKMDQKIEPRQLDKFQQELLSRGFDINKDIFLLSDIQSKQDILIVFFEAFINTFINVAAVGNLNFNKTKLLKKISFWITFQEGFASGLEIFGRSIDLMRNKKQEGTPYDSTLIIYNNISNTELESTVNRPSSVDVSSETGSGTSTESSTSGL